MATPAWAVSMVNPSRQLFLFVLRFSPTEKTHHGLLKIDATAGTLAGFVRYGLPSDGGDKD
jgi:hypothetical protein